MWVDNAFRLRYYDMQELPDVPLFVSLHNLCATLKCTSPSAVIFRSAVINAGYRISSSHVNPLGLKTDAPMDAIWDIMRCWVFHNHSELKFSWFLMSSHINVYHFWYHPGKESPGESTTSRSIWDCYPFERTKFASMSFSSFFTLASNFLFPIWQKPIFLMLLLLHRQILLARLLLSAKRKQRR